MRTRRPRRDAPAPAAPGVAAALVNPGPRCARGCADVQLADLDEDRRGQPAEQLLGRRAAPRLAAPEHVEPMVAGRSIAHLAAGLGEGRSGRPAAVGPL